MLNEWSDRRPPGPRRPFYRQGEFWVGVFVVAVCGGFLLGLFSCVVG
jgi:hypothetical protein